MTVAWTSCPLALRCDSVSPRSFVFSLLRKRSAGDRSDRCALDEYVALTREAYQRITPNREVSRVRRRREALLNDDRDIADAFDPCRRETDWAVEVEATHDIAVVVLTDERRIVPQRHACDREVVAGG